MPRYSLSTQFPTRLIDDSEGLNLIVTTATVKDINKNYPIFYFRVSI